MEISTSGYATLFAVQILHRYYLDVGDQPFETLDANSEEKGRTSAVAAAAARRTYDIGRFCRIVPDEATAMALRNGRLFFKPAPDGFRIAAEINGLEGYLQVPLPLELTMRFGLYLTDPAFTTYTDISLEESGRMSRPDAVCVWSNKDGSALLLEEGLSTASWKDVRDYSPTGMLTAKPFALIEIVHKYQSFPQLTQEETNAEGKLQQHPRSIRYQVVIDNRWVLWQHNKNFVDTLGSEQLREARSRRQESGRQGYSRDNVPLFPMLSQGRLEVPDRDTGLPLPNPLATSAQLDCVAQEYVAIIP